MISQDRYESSRPQPHQAYARLRHLVAIEKLAPRLAGAPDIHLPCPALRGFVHPRMSAGRT